MVLLTDAPLDARVLEAAVAHPGNGAILTFAGVARNDNVNDPSAPALVSLFYEAWPDVAERELRAIADEAARRWFVRVAIAHRTGTVAVGEPSVLVVVGAAHRGEAYEASRYVIDTLKAKAPIWKKELYADGSTWVSNTP